MCNPHIPTSWPDRAVLPYAPSSRRASANWASQLHADGRGDRNRANRLSHEHEDALADAEKRRRRAGTLLSDRLEPDFRTDLRPGLHIGQSTPEH